MKEEKLLGGNLSDAVRVGDTVRRRAGPWTPAVHELLRFLERSDFEAPRVLGVDDRGREILTFVEGDSHPGWPDPLPDWTFDEAHLVSGAKLLRRYHDLVAAFTPPPSSRWRLVAPTPHEVICHNDWSPWNAIYRDRRVAVMLDWDLAGPGSRLWDIANSAYCWVPLFSAEGRFAIDERARRLRVFCDAYGALDRKRLIDVLIERTLFVGEVIEREADAGDPGFRKLAGWEVPDRMRRDATYVENNRTVLESALGDG